MNNINKIGGCLCKQIFGHTITSIIHIYPWSFSLGYSNNVALRTGIARMGYLSELHICMLYNINLNEHIYSISIASCISAERWSTLESGRWHCCPWPRGSKSLHIYTPGTNAQTYVTNIHIVFRQCMCVCVYINSNIVFQCGWDLAWTGMDRTCKVLQLF